MQRERSYRMRDPDEYSGEGQREPERFLLEFQRAFEVKPVTYQEDLTRVYIKNYLCTSVRISRLVGHKKCDFLIDLRDSHPKASWPEMEKIYGGRVPRDRYRKPLQPCDRPRCDPKQDGYEGDGGVVETAPASSLKRKAKKVGMSAR